MAISRAVRPAVVVAGAAVRVRELRRKKDGTRYGHEVVLAQDTGAQIAVTFYESEDSFSTPLPGVGEFFAAEVTVEESRDFGATLIYERPASDYLDTIHSALATAAK